MLKAVEQDGLALRYMRTFYGFSENFQEDKEVVLKAVSQNGHSLRYASEKLQKDKDILKLIKK